MDIGPCQVARENFESNVLTIERRREPMSSSVFGFFGLCDNPFSISPNPRFLYPTLLAQAASQQLVEAQGLPLHTLEEIRLLLNLETPSEKLLQVILSGQPELEEKLKSHELRQFRQRITVRCRTAPLTLQETQAYIQDHLRTAGAKQPIFHPKAAIFVHAYPPGNPARSESSLRTFAAQCSCWPSPGLFHLSVSNAPLRIASLTRSILSPSHSIPAALQHRCSPYAHFSPECLCPIVRRQVRRIPWILRSGLKPLQLPSIRKCMFRREISARVRSQRFRMTYL